MYLRIACILCIVCIVWIMYILRIVLCIWWRCVFWGFYIFEDTYCGLNCLRILYTFSLLCTSRLLRIRCMLMTQCMWISWVLMIVWSSMKMMLNMRRCKLLLTYDFVICDFVCMFSIILCQLGIHKQLFRFKFHKHEW